MTKRHITPHKGGRTASAPRARIRPQTLAAIMTTMQQRDKSFADLLEEQYGGNEMTKSGFKTIKVGDTVIYKGHRLPQYNGCEAKVTAINHELNQATLALPDKHVALVTPDQIDK